MIFLNSVVSSSFFAAPTELESTSVVFVHGLDLYCTSMTPSKGFDLLNDDFDYYVISRYGHYQVCKLPTYNE